METNTDQACTVVTVRFQCQCGRWALWKASTRQLERHGLSLEALTGGTFATRLGIPPSEAHEVLQYPSFTCSCGDRVTVLDTLETLLRYSPGLVVWDVPALPAAAAAGRHGLPRHPAVAATLGLRPRASFG